MADQDEKLGESGDVSPFATGRTPGLESGLMDSDTNVLNLDENTEMDMDNDVEGEDGYSNFDDPGASLSDDDEVIQEVGHPLPTSLEPAPRSCTWLSLCPKAKLLLGRAVFLIAINCVHVYTTNCTLSSLHI